MTLTDAAAIQTTRENEMTTWTNREAEIIDEHVSDFEKDNDRKPDWSELFDMMRERMAEEEESPLGAEFEAIVDKMIAVR